jgi:hypothetical protein
MSGTEHRQREKQMARTITTQIFRVKCAVVARENGGIHDLAFIRENTTIVFATPEEAEE